MNRTEIFQALIPILANTIRDSKSEQITLGALIIEDLGADSLDNVEAIMEIEDHFGIEIVDKVAEKIKTVEDLVDAVFNSAPDESAPEPDPDPALQPLNTNSVLIYIDNTIRQKRDISGHPNHSSFVRDKARHQIEVLQEMRKKLFGIWLG